MTFFVSYARVDEAFVLKLVADLKAADIALFVDQLDITPGERWDASVASGVSDSAGLIVVLTPAAVASDHVLDEINACQIRGKPVIPVLLEPCEMPISLLRVQHINVSDYDAALSALIVAIKGTRPAKRHWWRHGGDG